MTSLCLFGLLLTQTSLSEPPSWKNLVSSHVKSLSELPHLLEYEGIILEGESAYPMAVSCSRSGTTSWGRVDFTGAPTAETWQDSTRQIAAYHTTREYAVLPPSSLSPLREWEVWSAGPFPQGEVQMQVMVTGIIVFAVGEAMTHVGHIEESLTSRETLRHTYRAESGGSIRVMTVWVEKSSGIIVRLQFRARDTRGEGIDSYLALRRKTQNPPAVAMSDAVIQRRLAGYLQLPDSN